MTQRENRVLVVVETFSAISGEKPSTSSWEVRLYFLSCDHNKVNRHSTH
jgi:hypothetical protein